MQIVFNDPKKENINFETLTSAYRKLFLGTKEGEIILNDLSQKARICIQAYISLPYDLSQKARICMPVFSRDSSELFFIEGMRNLFCYITSHLEEKVTEESCIQDYDPFDKKD